MRSASKHAHRDAVENVRKITGKDGVTAVFDFVGYQPTINTAMGVVGTMGDVTIVGLGDGKAAASVGFWSQPYEVSVRTPYWGARAELIEVLDLARDVRNGVREAFGVTLHPEPVLVNCSL